MERQIIDQLPADATRDDVLYRIGEHKEIESGLTDSDAGRTTPVEDVVTEFGTGP
ncbi:hypothetical protein OLMES_1807 [Oleiphilus messinensis]|uniref:Uncharacterized protein n=2 Tax=Oleiphilus messinensis TaxID=141451 RepID=A0A1Y0I636_9GAMM|nr:hypothetical protein OLMES_1807 [Oleiphilus messinensis]